MKIILGAEGCQKCKFLKEQHKDAEYKELSQEELLTIAKLSGVKELPIVVTTGEDIKL